MRKDFVAPVNPYSFIACLAHGEFQQGWVDDSIFHLLNGFMNVRLTLLVVDVFHMHHRNKFVMNEDDSMTIASA
jgi:hypothetical protein